MMADEHGYMASVLRVNVECTMTVSSQCSGCSDMSETAGIDYWTGAVGQAGARAMTLFWHSCVYFQQMNMIFHYSSTTVDASEVALLRDSLESMAQAELAVA